MSIPPDIIGIVKKYQYGLSHDALYCLHVIADKTLQEIQAANQPMPNGAVFSPRRVESLHEVVQFIAGVLVEFPAITQALLDREEKLRIAVEALEDIQKVHLEASTRPGGYVSVSSQVMCNKTFEALSLIRSPLPS